MNAFSGLRIRQFFVCHQPQSIQVTECSFLITNCAGMRASFTICVKPANEHMPCAFRSSHPAGSVSPLRAAYLMTAAFYHASAVKSGRPAKPESTGCYRLADASVQTPVHHRRRVIRLTRSVQLSSSAPPRFARLVSCPAINSTEVGNVTPYACFAVDGASTLS